MKEHDWSPDAQDPVKYKKVTERNGPSMIPVNLFDFFPQAGPTSIESMDHVFHRTWLTQGELEARAELKGEDGKPIYKNIKKALQEGPHGSGAGDKELSNEAPEDGEGRRGSGGEVS
jgi:hypothetical protein